MSNAIKGPGGGDKTVQPVAVPEKKQSTITAPKLVSQEDYPEFRDSAWSDLMGRYFAEVRNRDEYATLLGKMSVTDEELMTGLGSDNAASFVQKGMTLFLPRKDVMVMSGDAEKWDTGILISMVATEKYLSIFESDDNDYVYDSDKNEMYIKGAPKTKSYEKDGYRMTEPVKDKYQRPMYERSKDTDKIKSYSPDDVALPFVDYTKQNPDKVVWAIAGARIVVQKEINRSDFSKPEVFDKFVTYLEKPERAKHSGGSRVRGFMPRRMSAYFELRSQVRSKEDAVSVPVNLTGFLVNALGDQPADLGEYLVEMVRRGWLNSVEDVDFENAIVTFKNKSDALDVLKWIYQGAKTNPLRYVADDSIDLYMGWNAQKSESEGEPYAQGAWARGFYEMLRGGGGAESEPGDYKAELGKLSKKYLETKIIPEHAEVSEVPIEISRISTNFRDWGEEQEVSDIINYRFFKLVKVNGKVLVREISNGVVQDTVGRPFEVKFLGVDDKGNLTGDLDYKKIRDVSLESDEDAPSSDELGKFFFPDAALLGSGDNYNISTVDDAQLRYFLHPDYVFLSNSTDGAVPVIRIPKAFTRYPDDPQSTAEAVDARTVGYKSKVKKDVFPLGLIKSILPFAFKSDESEGVKAYFTVKEIDALARSNRLAGVKGTKVYRDEDEPAKWIKNAVTGELEPAFALRIGVTADTLGEMASDLNTILIKSGYPKEYLTDEKYRSLWLPKTEDNGFWDVLGIKNLTMADLENPNTWIGPTPESIDAWFTDEKSDDERISFNGIEITRKRAAFLVVVMAAYSGAAEKIDLSPAQLQDVAMDAQLKSQDAYMNDQSVLQVVITLFTMWMFGRLNAKATKAMSDAQMLAGVGGKEPDDYVKEYGEDFTDKIGTKNTGIVGRFQLVRRMASALLTRFGKPGSILLTGPAGTGKTVVVKLLVELTNLAKLDLISEREKLSRMTSEYDAESNPSKKKKVGEDLSKQRELIFRIEYAQEQIPQGIRNRRYISLDPAALTAGASFVNQEDARVKAYFEQIKEMEAVRKELRSAHNDKSSVGKKISKQIQDRLFDLEKKFIDQLIQETKRNGESLVIVVDEGHNLSKKAWEYLKPGLADGSHQVIVITTDIESKIIKDIPAMERRFEEIPALEMDKEFVMPLMSMELDKAFRSLRNGDQKNQADFLLWIMEDNMSDFKVNNHPDFFQKAYEYAIYYFKGGARPSNTDQFIAAVLKSYYMKWQSHPVIRELSVQWQNEMNQIKDDFVKRYRLKIPFIEREMAFFPKNFLFLSKKYRLSRVNEYKKRFDSLVEKYRQILKSLIERRTRELIVSSTDGAEIEECLNFEFEEGVKRFYSMDKDLRPVLSYVAKQIAINSKVEFDINVLIEGITTHQDKSGNWKPDQYNEPIVQGLKSLLPRIIERAKQIREGGLQGDALEAQLQKEGYSIRFNFTVDKIDDYIRENPPADFISPANEIDRIVDTWISRGFTNEKLGYSKIYRQIRSLDFAAEISRIRNIRTAILYIDRYLSSADFLDFAPNGEPVTEVNPSRHTIIEMFTRGIFENGMVTEGELASFKQVLDGKVSLDTRPEQQGASVVNEKISSLVRENKADLEKVVESINQTSTLDSVGKLRRLSELWNNFYPNTNDGSGFVRALAESVQAFGEKLKKDIQLQKYDFIESVFKTRYLEYLTKALLVGKNPDQVAAGIEGFMTSFGEEFFKLKEQGEITESPAEKIPALNTIKSGIVTNLNRVWVEIANLQQSSGSLRPTPTPSATAPTPTPTRHQQLELKGIADQEVRDAIIKIEAADKAKPNIEKLQKLTVKIVDKYSTYTDDKKDTINHNLKQILSSKQTERSAALQLLSGLNLDERGRADANPVSWLAGSNEATLQGTRLRALELFANDETPQDTLHTLLNERYPIEHVMNTVLQEKSFSKFFNTVLEKYFPEGVSAKIKDISKSGAQHLGGLAVPLLGAMLAECGLVMIETATGIEFYPEEHEMVALAALAEVGHQYGQKTAAYAAAKQAERAALARGAYAETAKLSADAARANVLKTVTRSASYVAFVRSFPAFELGAYAFEKACEKLGWHPNAFVEFVGHLGGGMIASQLFEKAVMLADKSLKTAGVVAGEVGAVARAANILGFLYLGVKTLNWMGKVNARDRVAQQVAWMKRDGQNAVNALNAKLKIEGGAFQYDYTSLHGILSTFGVDGGIFNGTSETNNEPLVGHAILDMVGDFVRDYYKAKKQVRDGKMDADAFELLTQRLEIRLACAVHGSADGSIARLPNENARMAAVTLVNVLLPGLVPESVKSYLDREESMMLRTLLLGMDSDLQKLVEADAVAQVE